MFPAIKVALPDSAVEILNREQEFVADGSQQKPCGFKEFQSFIPFQQSWSTCFAFIPAGEIWGFPKIGVPPKSSILMGCSIRNHPFWGSPICGNPHVFPCFRGVLCRHHVDMEKSHLPSVAGAELKMWTTESLALRITTSTTSMLETCRGLAWSPSVLSALLLKCVWRGFLNMTANWLIKYQYALCTHINRTNMSLIWTNHVYN